MVTQRTLSFKYGISSQGGGCGAGQLVTALNEDMVLITFPLDKLAKDGFSLSAMKTWLDSKSGQNVLKEGGAGWSMPIGTVLYVPWGTTYVALPMRNWEVFC